LAKRHRSRGARGFGELFEIAGGNDFGPVLAITL
jgi:hypothetical protein